MQASSVFVRLALAAWSAGLIYGCAVGAEESGPEQCEIGSEGCPCTPGGGCDPDLACLSGFCVALAGAGGNTTGPSAGPGGSTASVGGAPSTSSSGGAPTSNTTVGATTGATSSGPATTSSTAATTTSTSSGTCALAEPTNVQGCTGFCDACEAWPFSWDAVPGATHYRIRWSCSITPENVSMNITGTTTDFANGPEVDAGNLGCGFTIHSVFVMACDGTCCTNGAPVPDAQIPLTCGGGCCL